MKASIDKAPPIEWPKDALERVEACPACGTPASDDLAYAGVADVFSGAPGRWNIFRCRSCSSLYLDPRPSGPGWELAYRTYYTHEAGRQDDGVPTDSLVGRLIAGYLSSRFGMRVERGISAGRWLFPLMPPLRQQLDYFFRHLPAKPGRLLDVGCGNGAFLLRVARAGWHAEGIEPDEAAASVARRSGCEVATATLDTYHSPKPFDAITMSHVIEHVPDPHAALRSAFDLLIEGGTLWLATPNAEAQGLSRFGADWRGLEVPRHTVIFTAGSLKALLERAGYRDVHFQRRGRGARYSLDQSRRARAIRKSPEPRLPTWWVDLRAAFSAYAGEELVVSATKPR